MSTKKYLSTILLLIAFSPALYAGQVIDRIVAIVNGRVILQSQLEDDLCFEALAGARPLKELGEQDRQSALDHLVDQELLREQIGSDIHQPSPDQVQKRIQEIRASYPDAASESGWEATLARYGFNERRLEPRLTDELGLLREAELRLRPSVQIDDQSIDRYYHSTFLPQLHQTGAAEVPLPQVADQIREILTQQKIGELFDSWLQSLRKESKVRTLLSSNPQPSTSRDATR